MEYLRKISLLLILLIIIVSCKDSPLNIDNPNTLTTSDYWQTEEQIDRGLIAAYNSFYKQGAWTRNTYTLLIGNADFGTSYAAWTELNEWTKFQYTNYDFTEMGVKIWDAHYKGIFRANQVLDNISNVDFSSEEKKERVIGQAKFIRALYHFYLEVLWEDIPVVLETSSAGDNPVQKSPEEIWDLIESDLSEASNYLPEEWGSSNEGRPTKGSALALLGKAHMQQHEWQEAKDALEWLVQGNGQQYYNLVTNYANNFTKENENNSESVFEIQFSEVYQTGYDHDFSSTSQLGTQYAMNSTPAGLGWNNIEGRKWLVDYYKREQTTNGNNDPRLFANVWYQGMSQDFPNRSDTLVYGREWHDQNWGDRVFIKKYSTDLQGMETEFYWNGINFRVIRYSDVLLSYAEVLNEINNGPTPLAIECVNRVRRRANLPRLQNSTYHNDPAILNTYDRFLEHLQIERALELPFEIVRWLDIKRWGLIDNQQGVNELRSRDPDYEHFVIDKNDILPIPQSEVDNNPNLSQNPGY